MASIFLCLPFGFGIYCPAPSQDGSASRAWLQDNPRPPFDHVRAFSVSLHPRRLSSWPSPSANRSEDFHPPRACHSPLCFYLRPCPAFSPSFQTGALSFAESMCVFARGERRL